MKITNSKSIIGLYIFFNNVYFVYSKGNNTNLCIQRTIRRTITFLNCFSHFWAYPFNKNTVQASQYEFKPLRMKTPNINVRSLFLNSDVQTVHHVGTINSVGILFLKKSQLPHYKRGTRRVPKQNKDRQGADNLSHWRNHYIEKSKNVHQTGRIDRLLEYWEDVWVRTREIPHETVCQRINRIPD